MNQSSDAMTPRVAEVQALAEKYRDPLGLGRYVPGPEAIQTADLLDQFAAHLAQAEPQQWRCFKCGIVLTDEVSARNHFGDSDCRPLADEKMFRALRAEIQDLTSERDRLVIGLDGALCPICEQNINRGHSPDCSRQAQADRQAQELSQLKIERDELTFAVEQADQRIQDLEGIERDLTDKLENQTKWANAERRGREIVQAERDRQAQTLKTLAARLECRDGDGHYCPNCDNGLYDLLQMAKRALLADGGAS